MPALQEALKQLVADKPDDPIDFLADFMLKNSPANFD